MTETNIIVDELSFEIAHVRFLYKYEGAYQLDKHSPVFKFLCPKEKIDVVNNISFGVNYNINLLKEMNLLIRVPAWSLYKNDKREIFIFHPENTQRNVAVMELIDGFHHVNTIVLDNSYSQQPLPICVTALLLQGILIESKGGLIIHGSTLKINDMGYIFTGNSGVGKTTLSKIIKEEMKVIQITDDRVILREENGILYAFGNPFDFKIDRVNNRKVAVEKIYFLHHSTENLVVPIPTQQKIPKLLTISLLPYWNRPFLKDGTIILKKLCEQADMFDLYFKPNKEVLREIIK